DRNEYTKASNRFHPLTRPVAFRRNRVGASLLTAAIQIASSARALPDAGAGSSYRGDRLRYSPGIISFARIRSSSASRGPNCVDGTGRPRATQVRRDPESILHSPQETVMVVSPSVDSGLDQRTKHDERDVPATRELVPMAEPSVGGALVERDQDDRLRVVRGRVRLDRRNLPRKEVVELGDGVALWAA